MFELLCGWFEACGRESVGMAAHPVNGVIPICGVHRDEGRVPLITTNA